MPPLTRDQVGAQAGGHGGASSSPTDAAHPRFIQQESPTPRSPRTADDSSAFPPKRSQTQRQGRWSPSRRPPNAKPNLCSFLVLRAWFFVFWPPSPTRAWTADESSAFPPKRSLTQRQARWSPSRHPPNAKPNLCSFLVLRAWFFVFWPPSPTRAWSADESSAFPPIRVGEFSRTNWHPNEGRRIAFIHSHDALGW